MERLHHQFVPGSAVSRGRHMSIIGRGLVHLGVTMFGFGLFAGFLRAQAVESCYATAGVNNIIRGTGEAELLGDVILNCQRGAPTPAGMPIPAENFRTHGEREYFGETVPRIGGPFRSDNDD